MVEGNRYVELICKDCDRVFVGYYNRKFCLNCKKIRLYESQKRYLESDKGVSFAQSYRETEKYLEYQRNYALINSEKRNCDAKQYRLDNLEKVKETQHNYYVKNKEKILEGFRNDAGRKLYNLKYRVEHKDYFREYAKNNIESMRGKRQRRRSLEKQLPSTLTEDQWVAIKVVYKYCCAYCGTMASVLHREHVIPVSKGGGYVAENIVPSCPQCNWKKGPRLLDNPPLVRLML